MKTVDVLFEVSGATYEDISQRSGLPIERVEAIIEGRWTPSPDERERIARSFGVCVSEISWGHSMNPRNVRYGRFGLREDFGHLGKLD